MSDGDEKTALNLDGVTDEELVRCCAGQSTAAFTQQELLLALARRAAGIATTKPFPEWESDSERKSEQPESVPEEAEQEPSRVPTPAPTQDVPLPDSPLQRFRAPQRGRD